MKNFLSSKPARRTFFALLGGLTLSLALGGSASALSVEYMKKGDSKIHVCESGQAVQYKRDSTTNRHVKVWCLEKGSEVNVTFYNCSGGVSLSADQLNATQLKLVCR